MITILYPYRNRELSRVKRSFDSLSNQNRHDFKVILVDYGSNKEMAENVNELVAQYDFATCIYSYHCNQPWSRAKALNIGLKLLTTTYVFIADIDMIFRYDFVDKLYELKNPRKSVYFKVGFLDENESKKNKLFNDYKIASNSKPGAQGLSLFPVEALKNIRGFDEFFHFWGAEDEDVHSRLLLSGIEVCFYESEVLLLHQWHESYRKSEQINITKDLQLSNITRINMQHQFYNRNYKKIIVNSTNWGNSISNNQYQQLNTDDKSIELSNKKDIVDHFLFYELPNFSEGLLKVNFFEDHYKTSSKYYIKKVLGKKVPQYYSLKEINDRLLLHAISFYNNCNYSVEISNDLKKIYFKISK